MTSTLDWLADVLFVPAAGHELSVEEDVPATGRPRPIAPDRLLALPSTQRPRLLVPVRKRRTAVEVIRRSSPGDRPRARMLRAAAATAAATGILHFVTRGDFVRAAGDEALTDELHRRFPWLDEVGIHIGTVRPNRKPVLLLVDAHAKVRAFAKVGADDLTYGLVENEARALASTAPSLPIQRPLLIDEFVWHDRRVIVQSALPMPRRSDRIAADLLTTGVVAIASADGISQTNLGGSPYVTELLARADARRGSLAVTQVERVVSRHAKEMLAFGAWHGDLTPWNCGSNNGRLAVWDWERWAPTAPLGLDLLHYHLHIGHLPNDPTGVVVAAATKATPAIFALGVPASQIAVLQDVHLAELLVRFSGLEDTTHLIDAIMSQLEQRLASK